MKIFKKADVAISVIMIIISACYVRSIEDLITSYFFIGSWQTISMLVHAFKSCFTKKLGRRYIYHWLTFISIITMPLGAAWILLFTAPLMALYYLFICYHETFFKMQERPLALLK
jgi:hypothetical protein